MPINRVAMLLMPVSQAASWYLVFNRPLYPSVCGITLFYCLWAQYNRYQGNSRELGMFSMGLTALATWYKDRSFSMAATCLILVNFVIPADFILWKWNAAELAKNVKNDTSDIGLVWARVFKAYFVSNMCLWSAVLYKFYNNEGDVAYQALPRFT